MRPNTRACRNFFRASTSILALSRGLVAALTESGIVGLRCAGAHHFMDVAWKRAFDSGQHVGPRLFASGYFLTTTGGHFLTSGHALEVDGPYGWVKAIREQIKNGVDHIKLSLRAASWGPSGQAAPCETAPRYGATRRSRLARAVRMFRMQDLKGHPGRWNRTAAALTTHRTRIEQIEIVHDPKPSR